MANSTQNHDAFFMPTKLQRHNSDVRDLLDKVRSYIDSGDIQKAQMYADAAQMMVTIYNQQKSKTVTTF